MFVFKSCQTGSGRWKSQMDCFESVFRRLKKCPLRAGRGHAL